MPTETGLTSTLCRKGDAAHAATPPGGGSDGGALARDGEHTAFASNARAPKSIVVPIRTVPGLNAREHFAVRSKRVRKEREAVAWLLRGMKRPHVPCSVILTRIAPSQGVDDDNLVGALKGARDEIAQWLGVDDRHRNQVRYRYAQENSGYRGQWGVRIEFGPPVVGAQLAFDIGDA